MMITNEDKDEEISVGSVDDAEVGSMIEFLAL